MIWMSFVIVWSIFHLNTLRPRQKGRRFPDNIFKYTFLIENVWIFLKIPLKFIPMVWINNISALVQIMARRRPGNQPLSDPMMGNSLMHICITWPQWVDHFSAAMIWACIEIYLYSVLYNWTNRYITRYILPYIMPYVHGIVFLHRSQC